MNFAKKTTDDGLSNAVDQTALFKLSYGLFVLSAKDGDKDNGCIVNTVTQIASSPLKIAVAVNKANFTCEMIVKTGRFNISVLTESAAFAVFEKFGFHSGRDTEKFKDCGARTANGLCYINEHANSVISAAVTESLDCGSHMLFIADITQAFIVSDEPSVTYQYYFNHIKPQPPQKGKKGFVCKICEYVYEGDILPADFICPLCKHGAADFELR